ncbi:MAG: CopG family transcriptional regulator [Planctomycetota bacterium]
MAKTVTLRIDDAVYNVIKTAADGDRRTISNFIEHAALQYLAGEVFVSDEEMAEILADGELMKSLKAAKRDVKKGRVRVVA